ncbi:MAG: hypothetical protein AAFY97_07205 [Pseudomonadota bacterium]
MPLFRWLVRLASAALILGMLLIAVGYYVFSRSVPDYDRTVLVDGLSAPNEKRRSSPRQ